MVSKVYLCIDDDDDDNDGDGGDDTCKEIMIMEAFWIGTKLRIALCSFQTLTTDRILIRKNI